MQAVGGVYPADSAVFDNAARDFALPEAALTDFDAVVVKGGWHPERHGLPPAALEGFVRGGGQLLVLDVDQDDVRDRLKFDTAADLLGARGVYEDQHPPYLHDEAAVHPQHHALRFRAAETRLSAWLNPP